MVKFCDICTRKELADYLGIPRKELTYILYVKKIDNCYSSFQIQKKNGGVREIDSPISKLKFIQRKLANVLWEYQLEIWHKHNIKTNISHGFEKKKSIITNATIHKNKKYVLNIDLKDFFNSFHFGRVKGFFEKNRNFSFPPEVATVIAQLTCFRGSLPQGAPTSPIITNLICQILDIRLLRLSKKYKLDYTRYADDLTFSTNNKSFLELKDNFLLEIQSEIERAGFKINEKKTRLIYKDSRQTVTGLIVNKKINVPKIYIRETKAMAHSLYTNGTFTINGNSGTILQLEGRFGFINQIDEFNNQHDMKSHSFNDLSSREREFKRFLFYKYFYRNSMPVIVTEGITDIQYLKAALKSLYIEYPKLIIKTENNQFRFKISFLKRTKRLQYFLGVYQNGADTIQNIYKYYNDNKEKEKKRFPNYYKYFSQNNIFSSNPVILQYDNEIGNNKPLQKFIKDFNLTEEQVNKLKNDLHLRLHENKNIYLSTNPLIDGVNQCEIELLFPEEVRNHIIDGKTLSLNDRYDTQMYYGKKIFASYISSNFETIDFSRFRPLLNSINFIVSNYSS